VSRLFPDTAHGHCQALLVLGGQTLGRDSEKLVLFVNDMVLNPVVESDAEGAQFVEPARVRHVGRVGQEFGEVALRFADILVLLIQPMQQVRIERPYLGIEDLFFFPEVKAGEGLNLGHGSLDRGNPFGFEIEERGEKPVQVIFDRPMICAQEGAGGIRFRH
jgi:hypothetical protein